MPRFFVEPSAVDTAAGNVVITGDDARHIARSLRMATGEKITVCDGTGSLYLCVLDSIRDERVEASVVSSGSCTAEPPYKATVYQALVKGDRADTVVQKAVEYGACRIVFFESSRCIMRSNGADDKKLARYRRIAHEAAMQSGRGIVPQILGPVSFDEALKLASSAELGLFCYEDEKKKKLGELFPDSCPGDVAIVIGPEGGFSPAEASAASGAGVTCISLGDRILRTESAAPFVLAALSLKYELS